MTAKTDSNAAARRWHPGKLLEKGVLFGALAAAVLLSVRPWKAYFFTGLGEHWDPKVMGHWMAWNAQHILKGSILFPHYNADYFYPHMYTLAFGEMLWPESFVYAALWAFSHNRFLAFNGTMLVFWALAGVSMYGLLREFRIGRAAACLGGFIYCLMPFMMAFYIEFNMILTFVIPMLLLLFIRWVDAPSIGRALLFCGGFYIAITSCIYYTYMAAFPLGCILLMRVVRQGDLRRNKRFYRCAAVMAAGVVIIVAAYLYPYVILKMQGGYARGLKDFQISHAQALHYLDTRSAYLIYSLFEPPVRWSETYLFPGSVLALLSLAWMGAGAAVLSWRDPSTGRVVTLAALGKFGLWTLFWAVIIANAFSGNFFRWHILLLPVSAALLALYLLQMLLPGWQERERQLLGAMAAGAVICFFISLGPVITVRHDAQLIKLGYGPLAPLFISTPVFGLVRGLTRFAIIPLTYLVAAGCFMLDRLVRADNRVVWLVPLLIGMLVYEAGHIKYRYEDYVDLVKSPVMRRALQLPTESVLFQIPTEPKVINNNIIMNTIGDFHYTVNGISGFVPRLFTELTRLLRDWKIEEATRRLSRIWPPVFLIVDRPATRWLARGWRKPFPWSDLEAHWKLVAKDGNYSLYRLRRKPLSGSRITKIIRSDVLRERTLLRFSARLAPDERHSSGVFRVLVNGYEAARGRLSGEWRTYDFTLSAEAIGKLDGDRVVLQLVELQGRTAPPAASGLWQVRDLSFNRAAAEGGQ